MILTQLPTETSQKRLRLTCHQLKHIAEEYFLRSVQVHFEEGFETLRAIANHENFRSCVQSITYSALTPSEYAAELFAERKQIDTEQALQQLDSHTERIYAENDDYLAFNQSVPKFPRLDSINIYCGDPGPVDYEASCDIGVLVKDQGIRQLEVLQSAVFKASTKIRTLKIRYLDCSFFKQPSLEAWLSLKVLSLSLIPCVTEVMHSGLRQFLHDLTELEELSLKFFGFSEHAVPDLESVIHNDTKWTKLESLTLSELSLTPAALRRLININTSLYYLKLEALDLTEGSWIRLFGDIRGCHLKAVRISLYITDKTGTYLVDYLKEGKKVKHDHFNELELWLVESSRNETKCPLNSTHQDEV